jgi:hypothetical protein
MIKKWQIGDQIQGHNRGELRDHPEGSRGSDVTRRGRALGTRSRSSCAYCIRGGENRVSETSRSKKPSAAADTAGPSLAEILTALKPFRPKPELNLLPTFESVLLTPGYPSIDWRSAITLRGPNRAGTNKRHAASYANGTWTDLGTLGSGQNSNCIATSVNDSGAIVGRWGDPSQFGIFIYQNGNMTDLHAPAVPDDLVTPIINNAGQIVCGKFIYQNGVWQDVNTFIEPGSGWQLTGATAINNKGAIIGFIYNASQGIYRAGLLTPVSSSQQAATRKP